jgi:hypothetical protein
MKKLRKLFRYLNLILVNYKYKKRASYLLALCDILITPLKYLYFSSYFPTKRLKYF